jgi:tetratricopeptide (TPR) repeat protein
MPEKVAKQGQEPPTNRRSTRAAQNQEAHREAEHETPHKPPNSLTHISSVVGNQAMQRLLIPPKTATTARMMATHATPPIFSASEPGDSINAGDLAAFDTVQRQEAPTGGTGTGGDGGEGGEGATSPDLISPRNRQIGAERFEQAAAAYGNGDYISAIRLFTQLVEQSGITGESLGALYWNLAMSQYRLNRYAAALFNFERAVELGANRGTEPQEKIQDCRTHLGVATDPSGDVVPLSADEGRQRFEQGSAAYSNGDYITAARLFTQILEGSSLDAQDRARMEYNVGMCNYRLERYSTAISYYEHALSSGGLEHEEQARQYLTECRNRGGIATSESGEVLNFVQQEVRERFEQANTAYGNGDYSTALTLFTRMYEQDELPPEDKSKMLWNMAMCNYRMERWATALFMFRQYQDSGHAERGEELNQHLSECRQHLGIATNEAGEVIPLTGEQGSQLFEQGSTAYSNGDYITAARRFTVVYDASSLPDSDRARMAYNIGMCQYRLGRYAAAIPYFEHALRNAELQHNAEAQARLTECRRNAGATPAPALSEDTEGSGGGTGGTGGGT